MIGDKEVYSTSLEEGLHFGAFVLLCPDVPGFQSASLAVPRIVVHYFCILDIMLGGHIFSHRILTHSDITASMS